MTTDYWRKPWDDWADIDPSGSYTFGNRERNVLEGFDRIEDVTYRRLIATRGAGMKTVRNIAENFAANGYPEIRDQRDREFYGNPSRLPAERRYTVTQFRQIMAGLIAWAEAINRRHDE